ncbi:MAG: 16S rRNA (guanine(966)-N(2))-methyltransferase RsmD [Nitrospirae bacterium]|nr:16S rRNA (guanine(966)-N(2))-methyltransferase RsmD [Nitrospirota bacterium]
MSKSLRPTTSKVREALFNILRNKIVGASFLDLYSGTGAVGIEALRQGSSEVVFIEASRIYTRDIRHKVSALGFEGKSKIITKKVLLFLRSEELKNTGFDIIFLDPPYHTNEVIEALTAIGKIHLLKHDGVVIAEHFAKRQLPHEAGTLRFVKDYKYGETMLSFYKNI